MADASIQATFVTLAFASAWEIGDIPHIYVKYAMQRTRGRRPCIMHHASLSDKSNSRTIACLVSATGGTAGSTHATCAL